MLQREDAEDYVIAIGETRSESEFVGEVFSYQGLDYRDYLAVDQQLCRPPK